MPLLGPLFNAAFYGPQIGLQGQTGSLVDKAAGYIPGMKPDPRTDIGKRLGDVLGSWLTAPAKVGGAGGRLGSNFSSRPGLANLGKEYKEDERLAGAAAEAFRPGAGFPGQQQFPGAPVTPAAPVDPLSRLSPQDRAYQQERARVEAMVKSNPDMQKEEIAAARAKVRDQGMAIWAAKHKDLAKQVKPGQSGYEAIQQTLYPGFTPVPTLPSESEAMLNVIAPANQQGVRPNVTPMPGQLPSFGSATEGMFNAITAGGSLVTPMPQELIEKYKEQLLKQAK